MNSWFAKFRISTALDAGKPLPKSLRRRIARSEELRQFAESMGALDGTLKDTRPESGGPPALHGSIMRALRGAERLAAPQRQPMMPRLLPVSAVGLLALAAACWALHGPVTSPEPQPLDTAGQALEMANEVTRAMPSAMVAPMTKELEGLNRDLNNTAQFLLASLP